MVKRKMEYEIGNRLDRIEHKINLILEIITKEETENENETITRKPIDK